MGREVGLLLIHSYVLGNEAYENRNGVLFYKKVKDSPPGSEFDTYKVATAANSESTMHTITKRLLTKEDFEHRNDEDVIPSEYMDILMDNDMIVYMKNNQLELEHNKQY